jgi:hypothetical protein
MAQQVFDEIEPGAFHPASLHRARGADRAVDFAFGDDLAKVPNGPPETVEVGDRPVVELGVRRESPTLAAAREFHELVQTRRALSLLGRSPDDASTLRHAAIKSCLLRKSSCN